MSEEKSPLHSVAINVESISQTSYPKNKGNTVRLMYNHEKILQAARNAFCSGKTLTMDWRSGQLKALLKMLDENASDLHSALTADLRRCYFENVILEINSTRHELTTMISNLKEWCEPEKVSKTPFNALDDVRIYKDPYGVVLVIGAWNYPLSLSLVPMMGAIAAGNCVILKPSEVAQATAKILLELVPKYLDTECYHVVPGGVAETTDLLKQRFDYIFYTGSTTVGKIVRAAANKHLTPVTLELGGKSPVFIDSSADMTVTAKRLLWGKCVNAGQTCIAPDYVLCSPPIQALLVTEAQKILTDWYGIDPQQSPDLCRIVNERHYERLVGYLTGNGRIGVGGQVDDAQKFIGPTILVDVQAEDPIMQEEVFGPILPIVCVPNAIEAVKFINRREKPLALYVFSKSKTVVDSFLRETSSGSVCVNDTMVQAAVDGLPFGGVGASGMGRYHGKYTYDTFAHKKSVLMKTLGDTIEKMGSSRYPPYNDKKFRTMMRLMKFNRYIRGLQYLGHVGMFGLGVILTLICVEIA